MVSKFEKMQQKARENGYTLERRVPGFDQIWDGECRYRTLLLGKETYHRTLDDVDDYLRFVRIEGCDHKILRQTGDMTGGPSFQSIYECVDGCGGEFVLSTFNRSRKR